MGGGGMEAADVYYENVRVPKENLLGKKGEGFEVLLYWIAAEKVEQCTACVGIAQAALDEAIKYAKSRMVRGRPISGMQGIRWMLADMQAKIEAARWLTYRAAFLQDVASPDWMREAAAAKLFVVPAMIDVTEMSRRIHGAYGYTKEFKIERLCRAIAGATGIATTLEINKSILGSWLAR
jgi:alkylation response protein AidB-like acyl-CoA dehydrogenase